jgi:hypothetical protein
MNKQTETLLIEVMKGHYNNSEIQEITYYLDSLMIDENKEDNYCSNPSCLNTNCNGECEQ